MTLFMQARKDPFEGALHVEKQQCKSALTMPCSRHMVLSMGTQTLAPHEKSTMVSPGRM